MNAAKPLDVPWSGRHRRYLLVETTVGVLITVALSGFFCVMVFGLSTPVMTQDRSVLIDAALQAFLIGFMSTLGVTAIARRRLAAGSIDPAGRGHPWPQHLLLRSLCVALLASIPTAAAYVLLFMALPDAQLAPHDLLLLKIVYGVAVAVAAVPVAVRLALGDPLIASGR